MQQAPQNDTRITDVSSKILVLRSPGCARIHVHPDAILHGEFAEQWATALREAGVTGEDVPAEAYFDHMTGLDCFTYYR